jgi:hypothetical protein
VPERSIPQRSIEEMLAAIAMTERVSGFLAGYDERDDAIERLTNDVQVSRIFVANELGQRLLRDTGKAPWNALTPNSVTIAPSWSEIVRAVKNQCRPVGPL